MSANRMYVPRRLLPLRYDIAEMTLWRWERDPRLNFPTALFIQGRKFYDLAELEDWERRHHRNPVCREPQVTTTE